MRRKRNRPVKAAPMQPLFDVVPETDTSPAEVVMYGDICEARPYDEWNGREYPGDYVALDEIRAELDGIRDASEIVIRINSSGGDLTTGVSIHDQLRGFKGHKTAIVEGAAESAATLIMCAADTVKVHPASMFLIHNPLCGLCGYYNTHDIDAIRDQFSAAERSMLAIYAEKTGKSEEELQAIIDGSTWFVGQEAIDAGFADEMVEVPDDPGEPDIETDDVDGLVLVNGVTHRLQNFGGSIPARAAGGDTGRIEDSADEGTVQESSEGEDDVNTEDIRTIDDLRSAYPEMTGTLIAEAAAAERERIRGIEAIEDRIGRDLADRAKYGEPMSAEEAAYRAMLDDAHVASEFVGRLDSDLEDSGAEKVDAEPVEPEVPEDETKGFVDRINDLYNANLKGVR